MEKNQSQKFTFNDKILTLTQYKQSGRAHKFIAKHLFLPSRTTILKFLGKNQYQSGINDK